MAMWLGRAVGRLVVGLLKFVVGLALGLLHPVIAPIETAVKSRRRKTQRKRDVAAVKRDFKSLRKGRGSAFGKRTRKRLQARLPN